MTDKAGSFILATRRSIRRAEPAGSLGNSSPRGIFVRNLIADG